MAVDIGIVDPLLASNIIARARCRALGAANMREWHRRNPEKAAAAKRRNYQGHRDTVRARLKRYDERHPEVKRAGIRRYKAKAKLETLTHYGDGRAVCISCGYTDLRALTIDHVNGGGRRHRMAINGANMYAWLRKRGYPEGYQTLCANCQMIKRMEEHEHGNRANNN